MIFDDGCKIIKYEQGKNCFLLESRLYGYHKVITNGGDQSILKKYISMQI